MKSNLNNVISDADAENMSGAGHDNHSLLWTMLKTVLQPKEPYEKRFQQLPGYVDEL